MGQSRGRGKDRSIGRGRGQPTPQGMPSVRTRRQYASQNQTRTNFIVSTHLSTLLSYVLISNYFLFKLLILF